ncbi:PREDICTED: galactosylceramide sulfotransferase-like [Branchiostoma belcheri]|uniref:Galactosylceramide sulfotransferase-like n=1 Tax=Branchiostoma belcheri TaxID=7741 RepID=A0A6P4XX20_BRABE|nr:PREDICTED: galactosylceramide sulfotransferase-like [Branchiostoma belcheri]
MLPSTGHCQPHLNVAFLKVHKCGSSTVADLINRFGYKRKLIAALAPTRAHSILGSFGTINESDYKHPPGGKRWNIFTLHAIYNRTRFHQLMDPNTRYVTILREPLRRLQSAFQYFHLETRFPGLKRQTPRGISYVTTYLKRPKFWDMRFRPPQSKEDREHLCFRNCMARDLGLKENDYDNFNAVQDFIEGIDNDFTTVMILEYLPESLVLLKRRMCWTFHDILYWTSKKQQYRLKANITGRMKDRFYKHNHADVMLYTHFKDSFQKQIKKEGADFLQEVQHFKRVNENVSIFCRSIKPHTSRNMTVQKSKWSEAFSVNSFLCKSYDKPNVRKYWYPLLQSVYH